MIDQRTPNGLKGAEYPHVMGDKWTMDMANREAEAAIISLAFTATDLVFPLPGIEPNDFYYADTKFVYCELLYMLEAGLPITDRAAQVGWFKRPETINRYHEAELNWFDASGQPMTFSMIYDIVSNGGGFATIANIGWYVQEVRRYRIKRAWKTLAYELCARADEMEPLALLTWTNSQMKAISRLAELLLAEYTLGVKK